MFSFYGMLRVSDLSFSSVSFHTGIWRFGHTSKAILAISRIQKG
jgi:hypothetical protein